MKAHFCKKTGPVFALLGARILVTQGTCVLVDDEAKTGAFDEEHWTEIELWRLPDAIRPAGAVKPETTPVVEPVTEET